jgi:hypothetical protein
MDSKSKWLALLCAFGVLSAKGQDIVSTGLVQNASFSFVADVQTTNTHLKRYSINNKTLIDFLRGATNTTTEIITNDDLTVATNTVPATNGVPLELTSPKIIAKVLTNSQTYQFFIRDTINHEPIDYDISPFFQYRTNSLVAQTNGTSRNDLVRVGLVMAAPALQFDADAIGKQLRTTNSSTATFTLRSLTASCLGSGSVTNDAAFVTNNASGKPSHIPPAGPLVFSGRFNMNGGKFEPITNGIP